MTELSDVQLVDAAKQGNNRALEVLYDRYLPHLLGVSQSYTQGPYEPMDIVQEAWVRIIGNLYRYTHRGSFRAWAVTIVRNLGRDIALRSLRFDEMLKQYPVDFVMNDIGDQQSYLDPLIQEHLKSIVDSLPARQQFALRLHVGEGCSSLKVAKSMGCAPGTVRTTCHFALKRIRDNLAMQSSFS